MTRPDCSIHGDLARDLALGRLGDADVRRAEQALAGCGRCHDWHASLAIDEVGRGVAEAFAAFRAPARPAVARSNAFGPWLKVAAAAALVVGGGAAWLATDGGLDPAAERSAGAAAAPAEGASGEILLADDLESGSLDAWRVHPSS